jgi:hypothetical protein
LAEGRNVSVAYTCDWWRAIPRVKTNVRFIARERTP